MSKIELDETSSGYNLTKINGNFDKIEAEFQNKVLYRDNPTGEPNEMLNPIDMNGNRIYNLPAPVAEHEAARLKDVQDALAGATASNIAFAPYKSVVSTNVQSAMQEMIDDSAAILGQVGSLDANVTVLNSSVGTLTSRVNGHDTDIAALQAAVATGGDIVVVDNIAGLRGVDASKHKSVLVLGYWSRGDKGGGVYVYDPADTTTPEDGGLVFVGLNSARWKLKHNGSVLAQVFGARGDGTNDDRQYLQYAINACSPLKITILLEGQYVINSTLYYTHNTNIKGVTATVKRDAVMTVIAPQDYSFVSNHNILVNGAFTAFSNQGVELKIGVKFQDFGICPWSYLFTPLPNYHLPANYVVNCNGIDLRYTSDALVRDVVGKCLGSLVFTSDNTRSCHRPYLDGLSGYSCGIFINFQGSGPDYCAADILITNVTMVRMCDITLSLGYVDGVTVADCKFFQATVNNVFMHHSGFINIVGCTFFETGSDNVFFENCTQINMSGTIITRAGWYTYPLFSVQRDNLKIHNCAEVFIQAHLERASGYNYVVRDTNFGKLDIMSYDPRVGAGNAHDAVIQDSKNIELQVTTRNDHTYIADCGSVNILNSDVTGRVVSTPPWAFVAADRLTLDSPRGDVLHNRLDVPIDVGPSGSVEIARKFVTIPVGYVLRVYNIQYISNVSIALRVNGYFSAMATSQTAVVNPSDSGSVLYDNRSGGGPVKILVVMMLYNGGGGVTTVGANTAFAASLYFSES